MLDRRSSSCHHQQSMAASTTFSLFVPMPKVQLLCPDCGDDHSSVTTSPSSCSSTGSVDCTLSLGMPSSTRQDSAAAEPVVVVELPSKHVVPASAHPSVSWDVAADRQSSCYCCRQQQRCKPAAGGVAVGRAAHDAFVDRRCANCGTSSTPLWRNGPRGPKSLCNACGIRFKKEERRAASGDAAGAGCGYIAQYGEYSAAVACRAASSPGEGSRVSSAAGGGDVNAPFLAWRLNVATPAPEQAFAERSSLFLQYN